MNGFLPSSTRKTLTPELVAGMMAVDRWHNRPVRRTQTVAEHCHQVALLALVLAPDLPGEMAAQVMFWALTHDLHEVTFGDTPYPAKNLLASMGFNIDAICQDVFWGGVADNPGRYFPDLVIDLVDCADVIDAAVFARSWFPESAEAIRQQALDTVNTRLNRAETHGAYARAMQILDDLRQVRP